MHSARALASVSSAVAEAAGVVIKPLRPNLPSAAATQPFRTSATTLQSLLPLACLQDFSASRSASDCEF